MGKRKTVSLALLGTLSACGGGGGGPSGSPAIVIQPMTLAFAGQRVGSTSPVADVTVSNTGTGNLVISSVQLTGGNATAFAETSNCGTLAVRSSCTISVAFTPSAGGTFNGILRIFTNAAGGETDLALSGLGFVTGSWTTLTNAPPEPLGLCLLLTDATVMCQATQNWYRLTPDNVGSYVNGTWSLYTSFPSNYIPNAFASAVLADGRVAVIGGEYLIANGQANFTLSNMGMIFDPVTTLWQSLAPPPSTGSPNHWQCIGDAPASMLADGH